MSIARAETMEYEQFLRVHCPQHLQRQPEGLTQKSRRGVLSSVCGAVSTLQPVDHVLPVDKLTKAVTAVGRVLLFLDLLLVDLFGLGLLAALLRRSFLGLAVSGISRGVLGVNLSVDVRISCLALLASGGGGLRSCCYCACAVEEGTKALGLLDGLVLDRRPELLK